MLRLIRTIFMFWAVDKAYGQCNNKKLEISTRNNLFILSDVAVTYEQAEEKCQLYGGEIAQIDRNQRRSYNNFLNRNRIPGLLTTVYVLTKNIRRDCLPFCPDYSGKNSSIDSYLYRRAVENPDWNFEVPDKNQLKSIKLYTRNDTVGFNTEVTFCSYYLRDSIRLICNGGWIDNLQLYGGHSDSEETIKLYHYKVNGGRSTRLSVYELNSGGDLTNNTEIPFVYLPDISLFIGAQSELGKSDWFWINGTRITDSAFPTSDPNECLQMTWPLTYDDGVNLRPKHCSSGMAGYICRISGSSIKASLEEVGCDGSSLQLVVQNAYIQSQNATVKINISSSTKDVELPFPNGKTIIRNLIPRINYTFRVIIQLLGCPRAITTFASGQTGLGEPDPVKTANATDSTSLCLISWNYDKSENKNINFKIISMRPAAFDTTSITVVADEIRAEPTKSYYEYTLEWENSNYESSSIVIFQIQAVSSCGNESTPTHVSGACYTPSKTTTTTITSSNPLLDDSNNNIAVILAITFGVLLLAAIGALLFCYYKRLKAANSSPNEAPKQSSAHTEYVEPNNIRLQITQNNSNRVSYENIGLDYENMTTRQTYEIVL